MSNEDKKEVRASEEYTPTEKPQHKQKSYQQRTLQPKKPIKHHLKIVYEDSTKTVAQVVLEIKEYEFALTHEANIERCMEEIYEVGGFWLNKTTMIPYSKIYSVSTHVIMEETENRPKQQDSKRVRGNRHRGNKPKYKNNSKPITPPEPVKPVSPPSPGIIDLS